MADDSVGSMTGVPHDSSTVLMTILVSALLLFSSAIGLLAWRAIYASETHTLVDSAAAQDAVSVVVAVLLLVVAAAAVRTGSVLATLAWAGLLAFVAYNAAIYGFSVHFGALFLVWTALLGLSVFGAVATAAAIDRSMLSPLLASPATKILAWVLIAAALVFALLWLKEIVADLLAGAPSRSAAQWHVPTNPVHVLDLALFLPAVMTGGVSILRGDPLGVVLGVPALVWLILTCLPILLTPVMAGSRGHTPTWAVVPPVAVLLVVFLATGALVLKEASKL